MSDYNATAIEVLTGLDPVRKRPGMYTDTSRPNHLVQEVVDGDFDQIEVLQVRDDGTVDRRAGHVVIAHGDTVIESGDHVIVFCLSKTLVRKVEALFQVSVGFL